MTRVYMTDAREYDDVLWNFIRIDLCYILRLFVRLPSNEAVTIAERGTPVLANFQHTEFRENLYSKGSEGSLCQLINNAPWQLDGVL